MDNWIKRPNPVLKTVGNRFDTRRGVWLKILAALLLITSAHGMLIPQEMETTVDVHMPLFFKILTFDRNFKARFGNEIVMGILYQEKFRKSLNIKQKLEAFLEEFSAEKGGIDGVSLRIVPVDLPNLNGLEEVLEQHRINIVYLTPLRAIDIKALVSICQEYGITTLTGVAAYSKAGAAVSIDLKGGNPLIIINLTAAVSEGADFSSRLLKLAKVLR